MLFPNIGSTLKLFFITLFTFTKNLFSKNSKYKGDFIFQKKKLSKVNFDIAHQRSYVFL